MKLATFEAVAKALDSAEVRESFDFTHEYDAARRGELVPDLYVRFVSIPMLVAMKRSAGRPRDLDDIQHLEWLQENPSDE